MPFVTSVSGAVAMRELLWLLALAADVVHGYAGSPAKWGAYHKRQAIHSNGLSINGSRTNGSSITGPFADANNPTGTPEVIWDRKKGDGKADYEPKGIRGPSLPAGLPADQIPAGWEQWESL